MSQPGSHTRQAGLAGDTDVLVTIPKFRVSNPQRLNMIPKGVPDSHFKNSVQSDGQIVDEGLAHSEDNVETEHALGTNFTSSVTGAERQRPEIAAAAGF